MAELLKGGSMFRYVISIQAREFEIILTHDAVSQWDDITRKSLTARISGVVPRLVVSLQVSDEIFLLATEMAKNQFKRGASSRRSRKHMFGSAGQVVEMDRLLEAFFWQEVNYRLREPMTKVDQQ